MIEPVKKQIPGVHADEGVMYKFGDLGYVSVYVQAKDVQIDEGARTRYGVFGKTAGRASTTDVGWWRYRVPGRGSSTGTGSSTNSTQPDMTATSPSSTKTPYGAGLSTNPARHADRAHTLRPLIVQPG